MKKSKVLLALVLVLALCLTMFAACQKGGTTPADPAKPGEAEGQTPAKTYDPEDYVDVVLYMFDLRMTGADHGERIQQVVNEYIGPKYGVQLQLTYFTIGDWMQKVQLTLSGGERVDLMPLCFGNGVTNLTEKNMLREIRSLLQEFAPEAYEMTKDYQIAYERGEGLYGLPTLRGYVTNSYVIMRKDILEEIGMLEKAENLNSWSGFEEILAAVDEKYKGTGLWPTSKGAGRSVLLAYLYDGDSFDSLYQWDAVGDGYGMITTDSEGHLSWLQDDPRYVTKLEMAKRWKDNGWIWPDSALTDTHGDELFKQNVTFSDMDESEYGVESVKSGNCGHPLICVQYAPGWIMTSTLTKTGIGIPINADEPEGAARIINGLYTDEKLMNMLIRGIEGTDYTVENGEIIYPESGYYYEADFIMGNNTLLVPLAGQGADYFEQIKKINAAAHLSEYLGFNLDTVPLIDLSANISAVNDQYTADLFTGGYTPALLDEYKGKLETAGVHDYIAEMQRQLDAWMAAK